MEKKKYQAPQMKVHEMEPMSIICTSVTGNGNEPYEIGSTDDWFE